MTDITEEGVTMRDLRPMTANKMPEMPEAADALVMHGGDGWTQLQVADYGLACYLAGIAAARECVSATARKAPGPLYAAGWDDCRNRTLANLSALEQGVGK